MPGSRRGYNEAFARFFESPTREGLRDLLRDNRGEANELDFKRTWPRASKLAKHVFITEGVDLLRRAGEVRMDLETVHVADHE